MLGDGCLMLKPYKFNDERKVANGMQSVTVKSFHKSAVGFAVPIVISFLGLILQNINNSSQSENDNISIINIQTHVTVFCNLDILLTYSTLNFLQPLENLTSAI